MSWGALNNQRDRTSAEPLPGFLTGGQGGKGSYDRIEPQFQEAEDDRSTRSERQYYAPRQESSRGYGVSYSSAISIQMSKKTLFLSIVFFTTAILAAFSVGYVVGNLSSSMMETAPSVSLPIKKPIVPVKKKAVQPQIKKRAVPAVVTEDSAINKAEEPLIDQSEKNVNVSSKKNNDKEHDSETIDDAPQAMPEPNELVD